MTGYDPQVWVWMMCRCTVSAPFYLDDVRERCLGCQNLKMDDKAILVGRTLPGGIPDTLYAVHQRLPRWRWRPADHIQVYITKG